MNEHHAGSCLCGAVRYEVEGVFEHFFLCHCSHCRKDTGSAHAANLFAAGATLRWLAGQDKVSTFRLPGTRHARSFCAICGSALPLAAPGMLVVPAGSLDDAPGMRPQAHLFTASRADWDDALETLPGFERFPV